MSDDRRFDDIEDELRDLKKAIEELDRLIRRSTEDIKREIRNNS